MLSAFVRAFRTPDLRRKLLFTIGIMVIFRVGSFLPTPGVSYPNVQTCVEQSKGNATRCLFEAGAEPSRADRNQIEDKERDKSGQ